MTGGEPVDYPQPQTLRPGVRTFKPRRTRMTPRAEAAFVDHADLLLPLQGDVVELARVWGAGVPVVMEIGCGDGRATARMAEQDPATGVWAVDVHTPGIGSLLARLGDAGLTHVRVTEADAIVVLERMVLPASLAGVRSYFPDPWPKARHHKRRLVQPAILDLVRSRLVPGGFWHLATDWAEYAEQVDDTFGRDPEWTGGRIDRPEGRPVTHYESRALREEREISDWIFCTTP